MGARRRAAAAAAAGAVLAAGAGGGAGPRGARGNLWPGTSTGTAGGDVWDDHLMLLGGVSFVLLVLYHLVAARAEVRRD